MQAILGSKSFACKSRVPSRLRNPYYIDTCRSVSNRGQKVSRFTGIKLKRNIATEKAIEARAKRRKTKIIVRDWLQNAEKYYDRSFGVCFEREVTTWSMSLRGYIYFSFLLFLC